MHPRELRCRILVEVNHHCTIFNRNKSQLRRIDFAQRKCLGCNYLVFALLVSGSKSTGDFCQKSIIEHKLQLGTIINASEATVSRKRYGFQVGEPYQIEEHVVTIDFDKFNSVTIFKKSILIVFIFRNVICYGFLVCIKALIFVYNSNSCIALSVRSQVCYRKICRSNNAFKRFQISPFANVDRTDALFKFQGLQSRATEKCVVLYILNASGHKQLNKRSTILKSTIFNHRYAIFNDNRFKSSTIFESTISDLLNRRRYRNGFKRCTSFKRIVCNFLDSTMEYN